MAAAAASTAGTHAAKQAMRKSIRARLAQISQDDLAMQSAVVTQKILAHPAYAHASSLSVYVSMPTSELQTDEIVRHALANDKRVFIPYTPPGKGSRMELLRLNDLDDFDRLTPDKWKIRAFSKEGLESRQNALDEQTKRGLDLILMPGLGFDRHLNRLGHGRGYYDTYLARCAHFAQKHGLPRPIAIALALDEQVLPHPELVPVFPGSQGEQDGESEHSDIKPDELIWPSGNLALQSL